MKRRVQLLVLTAVVSLVLAAPLVWYFERDNERFRGLGDAVWWWFETASTVGYGDVVPVTVPGRVIGVLTMVTGFFVFANLIAMAAESAHGFVERRSRGTAKVEANDHIVICEYTAVADELIQTLPRHPELGRREVVIVSDLVTQNPYPRHHFVSGVPISPSALRRASVERAAYVFVFANLRFSDPDVKTLHIALRVAEMNPQAQVMIELVDPANDLLEHAPKRFRVMDSRVLIRSILKDRTIDIDAWIEGSRPEQA